MSTQLPILITTRKDHLFDNQTALTPEVWRHLKVSPPSGIKTTALSSFIGGWSRVLLGNIDPADIQQNIDIYRVFLSNIFTIKDTSINNNWLFLDPLADNEEPIKFYDNCFEYKSAYVKHPALTNTYVRLSDFHKAVKDHKMAEFVALTTALGAKSIRLVESTSNQNHLSSKASADALGSGLSLSHTSNHNETSSLHLSIDVLKPKGQPFLPSSLYWYHQEEMWKTMAHTRLANWTKTFNVRFSIKNSFGVDSELASRVANKGISIGGTYSEFEQLDQEYRIEFFPSTTYTHSGFKQKEEHKSTDESD